MHQLKEIVRMGQNIQSNYVVYKKPLYVKGITKHIRQPQAVWIWSMCNPPQLPGCGQPVAISPKSSPIHILVCCVDLIRTFHSMPWNFSWLEESTSPAPIFHMLFPHTHIYVYHICVGMCVHAFNPGNEYTKTKKYGVHSSISLFRSIF